MHKAFAVMLPVYNTDWILRSRFRPGWGLLGHAGGPLAFQLVGRLKDGGSIGASA